MPSRKTLKKKGGSTSFGSANSKDLSPATRARRKRAKEYVNKLQKPKKKTSNTKKETSKTKNSSNPHVRAWEWAEKNLRKDKLETAMKKGYSKSEIKAVIKVLEDPNLVREIDGFNILEKRPYNSNDYEL